MVKNDFVSTGRWIDGNWVEYSVYGKVRNLKGQNTKLKKKVNRLQAENKRLREILTREIDDGRAAVDDIGIEAWIEQALKDKQ